MCFGAAVLGALARSASAPNATTFIYRASGCSGGLVVFVFFFPAKRIFFLQPTRMVGSAMTSVSAAGHAISLWRALCSPDESPKRVECMDEAPKSHNTVSASSGAACCFFGIFVQVCSHTARSKEFPCLLSPAELGMLLFKGAGFGLRCPLSRWWWEGMS